MVLMTLRALNQLKELGRAELDELALQLSEGTILGGSHADKKRQKILFFSE